MSPLDTEDQLRRVLRGELDSVHVRATSEEDVLVRARRQTRVAERRAGALVGTLVIAGGAALGWAVHTDSSPQQVVIAPATAPPPDAPVTAATPTTVAAPTAASTAAPTAASSVVSAPLTTVATAVGSPTSLEPGGVAVRSSTSRDGVSVISFEHFDRRTRNLHVLDGDTVLADIELPDPKFAVDTDSRIGIADLTGDGADDFLVPYLAQGQIAVVVSHDGGEWRLVPFVGLAGTSTTVYSGLRPRIDDDGTFSILYRSCDPSCAEGVTEWRPWVYVDGVFRPAS